MPTPLGGTGLLLPLPQNLYPSELTNAPLDQPGNRQALAPGQALTVPAGTWIINLGLYLVLQYRDPVTGMWSHGSNAAWGGGHAYIKSDGVNFRVANLTGCPVVSSIIAYGSGYVQSSTTITATPGNSTWLPIIGGQLGGVTVTNAGAGYGVAPVVMIPPPPPAAANANGVGGIPATGYAVISNGTVSAFSFTNPGAGYPTAPTPVVLPNPTDPNLSSGITAAAITFSLVGSGSLTGALCTNNGAPLSNPNQFTLSVAGAGSAASLVGNVLQTVTTASVTGVGTGFGASAAPVLSTAGGVPAQGTIAGNPEILYLAWRPRMAQIGLTTNAGGTLTAQLGAIYDGGLFLTNTAPTAVFWPAAGAGSILAPTVALTMGNRVDIVTMQPAP